MGVIGVGGAEQGNNAKRDAHVAPVTPFTPGSSIRVHLRLFAAILILVVSLSGCSRQAKRGGSANTLREPMTLEPATFDPARVNEGGTGGMLQNIFEGLV